ncbi:PAAR domain-containing protein [Morganella psychrotolerans]|uniref:PAAR domain-containing protein n=1 Tax=Morganella psychrotolerans TaxID=368603 RepID=A0A5M9RCW8_9GAMM|nr:PAAR domain-containing protein [Morganella psychrotolerans]KAA8718072.1 PAAR domain-containing protein [Morganella psychrotolerans]
MNQQKFIIKNDSTNTNGTVLSGHLIAKQKEEIAYLGDAVYCPRCDSTGVITEASPMMKIQGVPVALEGYQVDCDCSGGCILVAKN